MEGPRLTLIPVIARVDPGEEGIALEIKPKEIIPDREFYRTAQNRSSIWCRRITRVTLGDTLGVGDVIAVDLEEQAGIEVNENTEIHLFIAW